MNTPEASDSPERAAHAKRPFLMGWLDALRYTSSSVLDGIGPELRDRLCHTATSDAESIFIAHLLQMAPELATADGFQCFFSQPSRDVGQVVSMLDAWRNSEMDPVPAIQHLKSTSQDPRIQSVFAPVDLATLELESPDTELPP